MGSVIFVCIECLVQKLERQSYVQAHTHFLIFFPRAAPQNGFLHVLAHTQHTIFKMQNRSYFSFTYECFDGISVYFPRLTISDSTNLYL